MATISETVIINAPIERVFDVVTDPRRTGDWNPNIVDISRPSPLPAQVGTSWVQTVLMMGRQQRMNCRVTELDRPVSGRLDISGDQHATITTVCEPVPGGTRVTQTIEFRPPGGLFGSIAAGVAAPLLLKEMRQSMERQRIAIEREEQDGSAFRTS